MPKPKKAPAARSGSAPGTGASARAWATMAMAGTAAGKPAPLIDQVHRMMHLWKAGDVVRVDEYLEARGLKPQRTVPSALAGSDRARARRQRRAFTAGEHQQPHFGKTRVGRRETVGNVWNERSLMSWPNERERTSWPARPFQPKNSITSGLLAPARDQPKAFVTYSAFAGRTTSFEKPIDPMRCSDPYTMHNGEQVARSEPALNRATELLLEPAPATRETI